MNKLLVILPFLISIIISIDLDSKYYFNFYEFLIFLIGSLMVFKDIWNYLHGKDFWSFGNKLKANDSKISRLYWFSLMIIVYTIGVFYFLLKV